MSRCKTPPHYCQIAVVFNSREDGYRFQLAQLVRTLGKTSGIRGILKALPVNVCSFDSKPKLPSLLATIH